MKTKYYQLTERSDEANSIGVVKMVEGLFDLEQIKTALQAHFDSECTGIKIDYNRESWEGRYEIAFSVDNRVEVIDAIQTWLYF